MTKKSDVPAIRFKGFSDAWEQRKLSDLIIEYKETVDSDCTLPVLTSSKTEGVVLQEEHFGRVQNHDITGYNILPRNYCTYRNRSDGVDFTFNINRCCDKGIISKFYPVFYGNNSDIFFISMVLNYCDEVVREIAYTCTGTGQKVLSFLDLQKMNIRVPSYDEQKKISQYFEQLDNLITLHQRKFEKLTNVKKSMLEKMFPQNGSSYPEIRFKGFTDPWEQRKLGELVDVCSGRDYKHLSEGTIPVYGTGGYMLSVNDALSYDRDAIGIGRKGTIDRPYILKAPFWTVDTLFYAIPREKVDLNYAFDIFQNIDWKKKDESTGVPSLSKTAINDIDVLAPKHDEQQIIGQFFAAIDNLITLHQRQTIVYAVIRSIRKVILAERQYFAPPMVRKSP